MFGGGRPILAPVRVKSITIDQWRNFRDARINPPPDASFVCLVGENGSGKSALLELLAHTAYQLGLASGLGMRRPVADPHSASHHFEVAIDLRGQIEIDEARLRPYGLAIERLQQWDGVLHLESRAWTAFETPPGPSPLHGQFAPGQPGQFDVVRAGGLAPDDPQTVQLAQVIAQAARDSPRLFHLYIDAERYFLPLNIQDAEIIALSREDFDLPNWVKNQAAQATQNLYLQWMREMLGRQQRAATSYYNAALEAAREGRAVPEPNDSLAQYRADLLQVLPHLIFQRLDHERRQLFFDSAGVNLPYEQLSAGERELAFLVGQIDRFGVRDGLFLLDEPELHLNSELLRGWVEYLRSKVGTGQAWIATHALEAAEIAGPEACLVLERDDDRLVRQVAPLGSRPALSTLAGAVGSPAFSVARSRFILIEGRRERRERERVASLLDVGNADRFIEAGSCSEVINRVRAIRLLASEEEQLRVGGVVDWDFRSDGEREALLREDGVHVLGVQEIENFFLEPRLLERLLCGTQRNGRRLAHTTIRLRSASGPVGV